MKKALLIILLLAVYKVNAQNVFVSNIGEASFFAKTSMDDIDASSKGLTSMFDASSGEIVFMVPMRSFKFKRGLMEEHFNEKYVESDKYPSSTYKGKVNEKIDYKKDGEYEITSMGVLTIHGVEQTRTDKGKVTIKNGMLSIQSNFKIAAKDHKIAFPKILSESVADTVDVKFTTTYIPFEKKEK